MSPAVSVSVRSRTSAESNRGVVGAEDVDGDRRGGAVGAGDREGVGVGGAGGKLVVRRAGGVGPGAGGVDGEGAVAADGGGLRHEGGGAVDVADGEHAGGGDVTAVSVSVRLRTSAESNRGVVGAEDVDGDRGEGAVGAGDREGVGVGGAGDELVVCRAGGVGPGAGGVDGEGAVAADGGGLRHEGGGAVDVADGERAGGGMSAAASVSLRSRTSAESNRGVVGAEDVDGDRAEGAVGAGDREGVGVGGAGGELVVRRAGGVGPGAGGVDGEGAVAADGGGLRHEGDGAVDVADGERAGGGNVGRRVGLGQVADVGGEHRGVVDRGDGDVHGRGRCAACTVIDGVGEAVAGGLGAVVGIGEGAVVVVDDGAIGALAEAGDVRRRERAVDVAVVGQHVDRDHRTAFRHRGGIVVRNRGLVGRAVGAE